MTAGGHKDETDVLLFLRSLPERAWKCFLEVFTSAGLYNLQVDAGAVWITDLPTASCSSLTPVFTVVAIKVVQIKAPKDAFKFAARVEVML